MSDTIKIYSLSEKLPEINTVVYIFREDLEAMAPAVLSVFDNSGLKMEKNKLSVGDLYWRRYALKIQRGEWSSIKDFPYWTMEKNIRKFLPREKEIQSRSEILDL